MTEQRPSDPQEAGIEVPFEQLDPETLRRLIEEFVTRDGADWGDVGGTLAEKVTVVLQQLHHRQIQVVFDLTSHTANLVVAPGRTKGTNASGADRDES